VIRTAAEGAVRCARPPSSNAGCSASQPKGLLLRHHLNPKDSSCDTTSTQRTPPATPSQPKGLLLRHHLKTYLARRCASSGRTPTTSPAVSSIPSRRTAATAPAMQTMYQAMGAPATGIMGRVGAAVPGRTKIKRTNNPAYYARQGIPGAGRILEGNRGFSSFSTGVSKGSLSLSTGLPPHRGAGGSAARASCRGWGAARAPPRRTAAAPPPPPAGAPE
jgi:hypothetical protein